jgi:hypothetical protein
LNIDRKQKIEAGKRLLERVLGSRRRSTRDQDKRNQNKQATEGHAGTSGVRDVMSAPQGSAGLLERAAVAGARGVYYNGSREAGQTTR